MIPVMPKTRKAANGAGDPFNYAVAFGTQQALVGWYTEYFHDLIENDPEFRRRMREHAAYVFERLAKGMREAK